MSREGGSGRVGGHEGPGTNNMGSQPLPQFYPTMAGYQGSPQSWYPTHPGARGPTPWSPAWNPAMGYPAPTPPWPGQQAATPAPIAATTTSASQPDEYTVDTLRRVYRDDDGRVEIQRVKVRRHQEPGAVIMPPGSEAMTVVPVANFPLNDRRPPPRKNRRKQLPTIASGPGATGPYPWYPYMPCVPYPYPYPYYMGGCVWPPYVPPASMTSWSGNESERTSSRQDSLPASLDSQRLESRTSQPSRSSLSPTLARSPSPASASHTTDLQSLAPSDSVSVRGFKQKASLERALMCPTPPPRARSRASSDFKSATDVGKTQEWMLGLQRALAASGDVRSDVTDKSSFHTAPSEVIIYKKIPPVRKRRKIKRESSGDTESISDMQSVASDATFDDSFKIGSELTYAFRKLERSVDAFTTEISHDAESLHSPAPSPSVEIIHSSGDVTPTETSMTAPLASDIALLMAKTEQLEREQDGTLDDRCVSLGSISSLPSLATSKNNSRLDISFHHPVPASENSHPSLVSSAPLSSPHQPPTETQATNTTHIIPSSSSTESSNTTQVSVKSQEQREQAPSATIPVETTSNSSPPHIESSTTSEIKPAVIPKTEDSFVTTENLENATKGEETTTTMDIQENLTASDGIFTNTIITSETKSEVSTPESKQVPEEKRLSAPSEATGMNDDEATAKLEAPGASGESGKTSVSETKEKVAIQEEGKNSDSVPVKATDSKGDINQEDKPADHKEIRVSVSEEGKPATESEPKEAIGLDGEGRESRASTTTSFFSTRPSDDPLAHDTDSTDIHLPTTDTATADEDEGGSGGAAVGGGVGVTAAAQWVLQGPGDTPLLSSSNTHDPRDAWRAEVSLWRARLVVSLCRGRGLDRQDWATFHLLVHHPLTLDLKLSLLHAPRLCAANATAGPGVLQAAALHLAQYGEALLQPEASRQPGWRNVYLDPSLPWAPVKGAVELLMNLGYIAEEEGDVLRYPRRGGPEVSLVARLTLDLLVLGEELRLYLTSTHQYPANISQLFLPVAQNLAVTPDIPHRPPSSVGSFVSAPSEPPASLRPDSRASTITTDDDTETLQASVRHVKAHTKKPKQRSSSEEDITLKEDITDDGSVKHDLKEAINVEQKQLSQSEAVPVETPTGSMEALPLDTSKSLQTSIDDTSSISSNITSLPDLVSISSNSLSQNSQTNRSSIISTSTETVTPGTTPTPTPAPEATKDNPDDHIYEEIDVIRAQVQALRASSVPAESGPPPLPPKTKINSAGEDDSGLSLTYPQVEWSSASMPGSLRGGSTGARRKKRRAPMPPEFMASNWKQSQSKETLKDEQINEDLSSTEDMKKSDYRHSLNPFYEEIESVQEKVKALDENSKNTESNQTDKTTNGNPFLEKKRASGYIGKNPFYETVENLRKPREGLDDTSTESTGPVCAMGSLSQLQDDSFVVRPKRRAPKPPPPTPQPQSETPKPETQQSDKSQIVILQSSASQDQAIPITSKSQSSEPTQVKKDLKDPSDTSSSTTLTKENLNTTGKVSDGHEINANSNTSELDQITNISSETRNTLLQGNQIVNDQEHSKVNSGTKLQVVQTNEIVVVAQEVHEGEEDISKNTKEKQNSHKAPATDTGSLVTSTENSQTQLSKQDEKATEEAKQTTPKLSQAAQRQSLPHPKNPPPPPPTVAKMENTPTNTKHEPLPSAPSSPNTLPKPGSFSLMDEVPYIDDNEVKYAKAKKLSPQRQQLIQSGKLDSPPLSPGTSRQPPSILVKLSTIVPFIDDSDLPPDCPPPLPPGPPPESPPETPHNSPPETPHTSPPSTPRGTPPHSPPPLVSPPLVRAVQQKHNGKESIKHQDDEDMAPPIPPKICQLETPTDPSGPPSIVAIPEDIPTNPNGTPVGLAIPKEPPTLPIKIKQKAPLPPIPSEASTSESLDPSSGKHSAQRSMSEERYEIPDTSRAPPPRPPPPTTPQPQHKDTSKPGRTAADSDRYEIPEAPSKTTRTQEAPETEERYEIPEVVKEAPLKKGANGAPCTVPIGRVTNTATRRGQLESVFGPPKPPRRRKNQNTPPPRPPKSASLASSSPRPPSTTSSFSSKGNTITSPSPTSSFGSKGTTSSVPTPTPLHTKSQKRKRRSWPFLLCDCLYVNCRTYDDAGKK